MPEHINILVTPLGCYVWCGDNADPFPDPFDERTWARPLIPYRIDDNIPDPLDYLR